MCANDRTVNDAACFIKFELQLSKDSLPSAGTSPIGESVVDRLPRAKTIWQITPRNAGASAIEDRFDEETIAQQRLGTRS